MIVIRIPATPARLAFAVCALAVAAAASAQTTLPNVGNYSLPAGAPTPAATPAPTPPPPVIALPIPTPVPTSPADTPDRPRAAAPAARRAPARDRTAAPVVAASPTPVFTPSPAPASVAAAGHTPVAPSPTAMPKPYMAEAERGGGRLWWLVGLGVIAIAAIAFALGRRGRAGDARTAAVASEPALPVASDHPPMSPVAVPSPTAKPPLDIDLRPTRAGLNMMSAVVEGELTLTNASDLPMTAIRLAATLLAAHKDQDAELVATLNQPIGRPAVPAFALAPGETRTVRIVAPLARAAIRPMTAAGRPIFVPLVAVGGTFAQEGTEHRIAHAFVVGIERIDSPKLAPIWLDIAPRMVDTVAARRQPLSARST